MKVTLLVRAPKKPEKRVVVERDVVIGRGKDCNLRVLSNDVSRKHCQLVIRESEVAVRDFGSGNGTLINSQKIEPEVDTPLISGDITRIGPLVIKVEFESASTLADKLEPEVQTEAANDSSVEAATSQKETGRRGRQRWQRCDCRCQPGIRVRISGCRDTTRCRQRQFRGSDCCLQTGKRVHSG